LATLKDVAELAGVSAATASLALNNGPVNEKTRQRVIDCAKQLNYIPNRIGQILAAGKSRTVEFLMMTSDRYTDTVRRTALFYYLLEGILSVADEADYSLRFSVKSHDDADLQGYFDRIVGDSSVDGIIIVPQYLREYPFLSTLLRAGFPYVLLQPPRFGDTVNYVDMDNHTGGATVARLFRQHGYRRIALINGPAGHLDAIERERGFTETLAAAGAYRFA
jgi:DNA-binding LacI/PurR family transcriptional regulator